MTSSRSYVNVTNARTREMPKPPKSAMTTMSALPTRQTVRRRYIFASSVRMKSIESTRIKRSAIFFIRWRRCRWSAKIRYASKLYFLCQCFILQWFINCLWYLAELSINREISGGHMLFHWMRQLQWKPPHPLLRAMQPEPAQSASRRRSHYAS